MKYIKTIILSIIASISIVYLITIVFGTFTISYHPTTKNIEQNKLTINTKFKSVLGIKIEVDEFYTNQEELLDSLGSKTNLSNKISYYNEAVSLSIRYILILIPIIFFIIHTREKKNTTTL